jgi:NADPH-dependent 2,4-dienoyl-CoA reductase/sulfur reductase-like enzyme
MRAVVVGGDAAGMSAATRIRAGRPETDVVVLEMGRFTSYSACGIPYLIGGEVPGGVEALVARSPEAHRRAGIDVRLHHEATAIDVEAGAVEVLDLHAGSTDRIGYDALLIATGGRPIRPDLPGIDLPFVRGVQSLEDGATLMSHMESSCRNVVVVGGGYIGLEIAEAIVQRGCTTTVVERRSQPLGLLDPDLGAVVAGAMRSHRIDVRTSVEVGGFEPGRVLTSDGPIGADLVVLGIGVAPRSELAAAAGIELEDSGAVRVDARQATSAPGVWAAGDCSASRHRVTKRPVHIPLGTVANKQGRVAGINIAGGDARMPPVLGTAITKLCALEIAITGITVDTARDNGFDAVPATIEATTRSGYLPDAPKLTVRLTVERRTGKVLGGQIVGGPGAAKRIDTVATAITAGMTAAEIADLDLAYAPPFSTVWDPVAVAAREAMKLI